MYTFLAVTYNLLQDGDPPHTLTGKFNCGGRIPCLTGTREDIITEIDEWADRRALASFESSTSNIRQEHSSTDSRIFWINGSAGTGKTTIAYTMAVC